MFILTYRTIAISDRCTKTKTAKTRVVLFKIWSLLRRWRNWNWVVSARMYSNQFKPYTFDSLCSSGNPKNQRWFKSTRKIFKIHQLGFEHKIWNCDSKDECEEILLDLSVFGYRYPLIWKPSNGSEIWNKLNSYFISKKLFDIHEICMQKAVDKFHYCFMYKHLTRLRDCDTICSAVRKCKKNSCQSHLQYLKTMDIAKCQMKKLEFRLVYNKTVAENFEAKWKKVYLSPQKIPD